jgi:hypothetical protein
LAVRCVSDEQVLDRGSAIAGLQSFKTDDGRRLLNLIHSWFDPAWAERACRASESFEPFIRTWIAFNCWGNYVTDKEKDADMIGDLARNPILRDDFAALLADHKQFDIYAKRFRKQWPIFSITYMREVGLEPRQNADMPYPSRKGIIAKYMSAVIKKRIERDLMDQARSAQIAKLTAGEAKPPKIVKPRDDIYRPECWELHTRHISGDRIGTNDSVPLDWPHTLHAIYIVRCNLFHGAKSRYSDADSKLVLYAFQVLVHFMHTGGYLTDSG